MTASPNEVTSDRDQPVAGFLLDWRDDHRNLSDENRDAAGRYITAIVERDLHAQEDVRAERALAAGLWLRFREAYDGLAGPYMKSEREDFARALGRL
jgi:hypothetical protein